MDDSRYHCFVIAMLTTIFLSAPTFSQSICAFPEDSASIGIFVCDYLSHEFEGGTVRHYPICMVSDSTGIPMSITSQPPVDLGWILMEYACTGDTVFRATIIWSGCGEIIVPPSFTSPDSFPVLGELQAIPTTTTYMHLWGEIIDPIEYPDRIAAADSIWAQLSQLSIIHEFAMNEFHILLYLYPPSVGWFDPDVAKWILFIYRNPLVTSVEKAPAHVRDPDAVSIRRCLMNPSSNSLTIDFMLHRGSIISLGVVDIMGRMRKELDIGQLSPGRYNRSMDCRCIPSGLYVLTIQADGAVAAGRRIIIVR